MSSSSFVSCHRDDGHFLNREARNVYDVRGYQVMPKKLRVELLFQLE